MTPAATPAHGLLLVLSAASGTGKTTVARQLLRECPRLVRSVSVTTRPPRPGERTGEAYVFVGDAEFDRMAAAGEFLEWAKVHMHRYGTPEAFVRREAASGNDVLMVIDVQGGRAIKKKYPDALLVFLAPPTFDEMKGRLVKRASETDGETAVRLSNARLEIAAGREYDYIVENDAVPAAVARICSIMNAARAGAARMKPVLDRLLGDAPGSPDEK
ncbi:MAG: guanylate kinase [Deltaproteobacteria bacterium]|nr:guanylate kinase [Deltaproteobacteria bacterium]